MKSKKLISLLCAAAMTTSAFAGLVTTASAATENDILWSDTFNNAATGVFLDGTAGLNGNKNAIENSTAVNGLKFVTTNRSNGDAAGYTDSNGEYVYNGSYYAINEKADATDKYVRMGFPVFGDFAKNGRWAYVDLGEAGYTATAEKDVIMDFDLKLTSGLDKGEIDATEGLKPVLRVGSFDATAKTANAVEIKGEVTGDDWVDARIIVSDSTGAKLYINGEEVTDAANTSVKTLETIGLYSADGQTCGKAMADLVGNSSYDEDGTLNDATKKTLTPTADIDNVIIYNETAGVADGTSQAPGAQDQEGGTTPPPAPTEKVIPAVDMTLQAPENATNVQSYTFDDKAIKKWSLGTADTDDSTTIPGLNIHVGARDKGGTVATYAAVVGLSQGNALQLVADQYSTAGRTPRINFTTGLPIDAATNLSTALTFNVYLSAVEGKEDIAKPRLYFLKDTAQTGDDGAGGFRNVAAVLTASEGDVLYRGDDAASDVISAYIAPNEWHKVTMVITPSSTGSTYRVYIDDDYDNATLSLQYIATGDNATSMSDLPYIAVEGQAAKVGGVDTTPTYGVATIDNIVAYQGVVENPKQMLPVVAEAPTPAPPTATPQPKHNVTVTYDGKDKATVSTTETEAFDAVMAIAKYSNEGVLLSVDTKDVKGISSAKGVEVQVGAMNNGDQLMVWNSLEDMIPYGSLVITNGGTQPVAITGTVKVEGTAKVGETLTAAVEGLNEGATAKYQWQANTGADGAYENIAGATAATFEVTEDLVGKTLKVVVTADGYLGSIVSDATAAVEEADEEQDEITGTVTVSGTAKVGETLTAAVEGLNEGATAKYEWQANTGADGAYEKITGATAATFVVTEDLVGKTIKVVVTAIGYTGSIESAPTAAVEAADEEPVAVPTVETATLHDTTVGGVPDNELYTAGSYKVTTTPEDGYTKVAIAAKNLKKHKNGDSPANVGYWVGAKVTAPEGKTIKGYYFSKDKYVAGTSDFTECDENEISFYTNVGAKDQKIWAAVELSDESIYVYKLDTTDVDCYIPAPTVETATLHDTSEAVQDEDLYAEGSYKVTTTDETGYTKVAIAIEDLKEHRNADTPESFGYWVGAKVTAPEGKTIKGYYFSKDKYVAGTSDFTECDENEISFYTNVGDENQKIWAAVKLSDESIYVYKLDTTGVKKYSIYTFDDAGLTSGQISYSLTASDVTQTNVTDDEEAKASVADFGAGTEKVEAIPALDGWGYKHFAYSSMYKDDVFQAGRQSTASVDVEANAIFANGVGNKGCDGAVSFIPANNANATAKLDGMDKLIYTFDAIVTTTGGNQQGSPIIGITSATDGSTVVSEASTTIAASGVNDQAVTKKVVIEYGLTNKAYMIYVDGTVVASGVAANVPTGIYAQSIDKYIKVGIANLVVTGEETTDINGVTVTTPSESDGTLIVDKAAVKAGDTITITATPAAGKKVTAVKVNGEAVKYSDGYKYTVTGEEEAIVIIAEFARADATAVTVTGADSVTKGEKATYTAKVMSENLEIAGDITWSVAAAGGEKSADTTISDTGELTVAEDETAASLIVTASTKKDVANADDDTVVTGTKTVTVSSVAVYDVTKGETVNGTFTITPDSAQVAAGTEMTVVPSQEEGYQVKEVSYVETDDAEATAVKVENSNGYTFYAPAYNFTVNVEFEAIEYNITNNNSSADEHGNSVAIKVNGEDATTATIGQTVTIKPTVAQGYKVDTVKVMNGELPVEVSNNTFTMPAADVTVTVTFAKWDGIYYSEDFSAYNAGDAVAPWNNANGTYRNAAFAAEDDNVYLHGSCSGKQVGHVIHTLENPVSLQDQKVVVEYDFRVPSHDVSVISGVVTLGDSSDNVVLAVGQSTLESYDMVYYTGGAFDTVVNNGRWGVDENAESATAIQTGAANTTNWYHVKIVFDNGTADLTVTEKGNESNTYTASDIAVSSTDIENIKLGFGKVFGGSNSNYSADGGDLDNILIYDYDVYSAE